MARREKKTAIYAGTFDPITKGHLDIVIRAAQVFDQVIIAVSTHEGKNPVFNLEERVQIIQEAINEELIGVSVPIKVAPFDGLLVEFARSVSDKVTIVRGIRNTTDFDMEADMAQKNAILDPKLDSVYFMTREECRQISSSFVKELSRFGRRTEVRRYVPRAAYQAMRSKGCL